MEENDLDLMLKQYNEFLRESPIRNQTLPIVEHLCKLSIDNYAINEFNDKEGKTKCIQIHFDVKEYWRKENEDEKFDIRVGYDYLGDEFPHLKNNITFEMWWGGECYMLCKSVNEFMEKLKKFKIKKK